jgi:hypothetical protein
LVLVAGTFDEPQDAYVLEGGIASFRCFDYAATFPPDWIINGTKYSVRRLPQYTHFKKGTLKVTNVKGKDLYLYQCKYNSSNYTSTSRNATLNVYPGKAQLIRMTLYIILLKGLLIFCRQWE